MSSVLDLIFGLGVDPDTQKASAELTPDQFDDSKELATTEFVNRALGSYSNVRIITTNTVLTADDAGKYIFINANNLDVTLPDPATLAIGTSMTIVQSSVHSGGSIIAPGGVTMNGVMTGSTSSPIAMMNRAEYRVVAVTSSAYQVLAAGGDTSLVTSGYQKLPSGLLIQWGQATSNGSGAAAVTFPTAFAATPFLVLGGRRSDSGAAGGSIDVSAGTTNASSTTLYTRNGSALAASTDIYWLAIGL